MRKLNVGDLVLVREDLEIGTSYNHTEFTEDMARHAGKYVTICKVCLDDYGFYYKVEEQTDQDYWDSTMFIDFDDAPVIDVRQDVLMEVLGVQV